MEDGITRAATRGNGTIMEDGITRAVTRERRKGRSRGEVVRGIIGIRGLGPCFYLSPFGMCLRGVSLWLTGGDPDPDPDQKARTGGQCRRGVPPVPHPSMVETHTMAAVAWPRCHVGRQ